MKHGDNREKRYLLRFMLALVVVVTAAGGAGAVRVWWESRGESLSLMDCAPSPPPMGVPEVEAPSGPQPSVEPAAGPEPGPEPVTEPVLEPEPEPGPEPGPSSEPSPEPDGGGEDDNGFPPLPDESDGWPPLPDEI